MLVETANEITQSLTEQPSGEGGAATETILVVDDETLVLEITSRALRAKGYTVISMDTGAEALVFAHNNSIKIDLLMTDVIMPSMNGRQLAEHFAIVRPGIPILFVSGYTEDIFGQLGNVDDGVSFLPKPFTSINLAKKVREALKRVEDLI